MHASRSAFVEQFGVRERKQTYVASWRRRAPRGTSLPSSTPLLLTSKTAVCHAPLTMLALDPHSPFHNLKSKE